MNYSVPQSIKNFFCNDCRREVSNLRWKEISKSINKGSEYKCDECWDKFEKEFEQFCEKAKATTI